MPDLKILDRLNSTEIDWLLGRLSKQEYLRNLGFTPFPWQEAILNSNSKHIIINAARQSGKSTITSTDPCWLGKFTKDTLSIVLAPTEEQAKEDIEKIKAFIAIDEDYPANDPTETHIRIEGKIRTKVKVARQTARGTSKPALVILDEASQIDDSIYSQVVLPMFTNSPDGREILLSTPFGKRGFFYEIFTNREPNDPWERYEIRSPWEPVETEHGYDLVPYMGGDEAAYQAERAKQGIKAWFSPLHRNYNSQLHFLSRMGVRTYRQEFCCEFVETEETVFAYSDINAAFEAQPKEEVIDFKLAVDDKIEVLNL